MDPRKLERLLRTYQRCGVSEVQHDGEMRPTVLRFFEARPEIPVPEGDVEGLEQDWTKGAPSGLAEAYARIQKAYAPKPQKGRAS